MHRVAWGEDVDDSKKGSTTPTAEAPKSPISSPPQDLTKNLADMSLTPTSSQEVSSQFAVTAKSMENMSSAMEGIAPVFRKRCTFRSRDRSSSTASEPVDEGFVYTPDLIGGSDRYQVRHLSQVLESPVYFKNPLKFTYVDNREEIVVNITKSKGDSYEASTVLRAGPRANLLFNPPEVRAAIATCGGLCPGLNNVIRDLTMALYFGYGVKKIYGIQYGYEGFYKHPWVDLTPDLVSGIHHLGGTILGSSRGGFDLDKIVGAIEEKGITQLYITGGDGTHRGATKIAEECLRRKLKVAVAAVPKTIDNDIPLIDRSFGFETSVSKAVDAIQSAHVEAKCAPNGIGLVMLMGRSSGYIAMHATLASRDANVCLIPEVPFKMDGPTGLLHYLEQRLAKRHHCVIVMAEGAGLDQVPPTGKTDKSGNPVLPPVGDWMKNRIKDHFKDMGVEINLKYVDPSYMIRSVAANPADSILCTLLAQSAANGAMAGFTGFTVAMVNGHFTYVPMKECSTTRHVDPHERMWQRVLASTGQPDFN